MRFSLEQTNKIDDNWCLSLLNPRPQEQERAVPTIQQQRSESRMQNQAMTSQAQKRFF
jgi:hypothetical protein